MRLDFKKTSIISIHMALIIFFGFITYKIVETNRSISSLYFGGNKFSCFLSEEFKLHLTFDDGPTDTGTTKDVLSALNDHGVRATFFIEGDRLDIDGLDPDRITPHPFTPIISPGFEKYKYEKLSSRERVNLRKELLNEIHSSGHLIGSHTFNHHVHNLWANTNEELEELRSNESSKRFYFESKNAMIENLKKGKEVIGDYLTDEVLFIRLPFGAGSFSHKNNPLKKERNSVVARQFYSLNFSHIGWDIDSLDYSFNQLVINKKTGDKFNVDMKYDLITEHLANEICKKKGGIVLFHDIYPITAKFLGRWIKELKAAGHQFVSLKELHPSCFDVGEFSVLKKEPRFLENGVLKQCWKRKRGYL
jgi:peptidoglycan/xylan/chitin deacetylase (PgdA/CDA1 family)